MHYKNQGGGICFIIKINFIKQGSRVTRPLKFKILESSFYIKFIYREQIWLIVAD